MKVGIAGSSSRIALEFCDLLDPEHGVMVGELAGLAVDLDRYLICTGYLAGRRMTEISRDESSLTWSRNFAEVARFCDGLFEVNDRARVVLLGSESGFAGSYDMAYAGAKAALHLYVERKQLRAAEQVLVALAPHIIWDSGMTQRRPDLEDLERRAEANRLGRWLTAREVAAEALHLLFDASPAISGQVIRLRP